MHSSGALLSEGLGVQELEGSRRDVERARKKQWAAPVYEPLLKTP